jgi:hypothetical protein
MTDDDDNDNNETADYTNRDDDGETADYTNAHLSGRASERNCDGRTTACLNLDSTQHAFEVGWPDSLATRRRG